MILHMLIKEHSLMTNCKIIIVNKLKLKFNSTYDQVTNQLVPDGEETSGNISTTSIK